MDVNRCLEERANVNMTDDDSPLLYLAVLFGHTSIVELFHHYTGEITEGSVATRQNLLCNISNKLLEYVTSTKPTIEKLVDVRRCIEQRADLNATDDDGNTPLHLAVLSGDPSIVQLLLSEGADVNAHNSDGHMPLHLAVRLKLLLIAEMLLTNGAIVNARTCDKMSTSLHIAAKHINVTMVELLLDKGANVNTRDSDGYTPLHLTISSGYESVKLTKLLLNKGADLNAQNKYGYTPLHIATHYQKTCIVKVLLDRDADVNKQSIHKGTPLHVAARFGIRSVAELLLNKNSDVNASLRNGDTPLLLALRFRKTSIIKLLLSRGADVHRPARNNDTPLHLALRCKMRSILELILNRDVDVNAQNRSGDTPLHVAVRLRKIYMVESLLDKDPNINIQTKTGDTPLHLAVRLGMTHAVKLLLNRDVHLNKLNKNINTPLHVAVRCMMPSMVELLLKKDVDIKAQNRDGDTPLHLAVRLRDTSNLDFLLFRRTWNNSSTRKTNVFLQAALRGRMSCCSIVELLLNKYSDVDIHNRYGRTPLHLAVITLDVSITKLLLNKNANMHAKDRQGEMPLHTALCHDNISIAKLLIRKGADLNTVDSKGHTPLHAAIFEQLAPIARLLIKKGANVNKQIKEGHTPLHLALNLGMIFIVKLLLNKGAETNVRAADGSTPLHVAADIDIRHIFWSKSEQYIQKIMNLNPLSQESKKSVYKARFLKKTSLLELLLSKGANITVKNKQGDTPLHIAARNRTFNYKNSKTLLQNVIRCDQKSVVELLLSKSKSLSEVNEKNSKEDTPLHEAVRNGDIDIVELLLHKGAYVNAQNINRDTPLHEALRFEHDLDIVSLLLRHGADVMLESKTGETPLSYALLYSLKDNKNIISLLKAAEKMKSYSLNRYRSQNLKTRDIFESYGQDIISNINLKNKIQFNYSKTNDNCGLPGQLYETKLLCLFFMRVLNLQQLEHDILLGANIDGIGAMDDICLRYRVRGQRPVVMFMQAKHKEDSGDRISDKDLWSDSGNFSLRKYFKSYLMIKERFHVNNKDSMFEGEFDDVDCYFILYMSGKESVTKKTLNEVNEVLHKVINTEKNTKPFQYNYDDIDVNRLAEVVEQTQTNPVEYIKIQVKIFFSKLWFYSSQAKEGDVEKILKIEINKNYNNVKEKENNYIFQFHTNAIFVRAHDEIHKWWKQAGETSERSIYLNRTDDFFRLAKLACLDDVLLTVFNAMYHLKVNIGLEFDQCITEHDFSIEAPGIFNTILSRLLKIIYTKNILITLDNNLKNKITDLLLIDERLACQNTLAGNDIAQDLSIFVKNCSQTAISNNDPDDNQQCKHSKRSGTSEDGGVLFRTKMLCLVLLRVLNYDPEFLLGSKISGIRVMNDICLRFRTNDQQKPVVLFVQLIHRDDPENRKLTDEALCSGSEDFNLLKYFKSYLMIRELFQADNKNPMFEGEFCNVYCYFIVYTSAKENITKKKTDNKVSNIIKNILNTKQVSEPFQYNYDKVEVNFLTKMMVMDQIEDLGTIFLKSIIREKYMPNLLSDKLIARYHVAIAREVLQQCKVQPEKVDYRAWEFRSEFFDSDLEHLVVLKKIFVKVLLANRCGQTSIRDECQQNVMNEIQRKKLESLKIKLPLAFGNLDMTFRGNKTKRMKCVADTLVNLLKTNNDTKTIIINDDDVGPGKMIEQGIVAVNGGIGGAVGNLLVLDKELNMLKLDIENEALPPNASLFLNELKDDKYKTFNQNLGIYRFKINISNFPKYSFGEDDVDKIQTKDFLNKLWFSPGQAKEDEVERILKEEINKKYFDDKVCRNVSDLISLQSHDVIQKWWLQEAESPYLSRASELFECVELVQMYNLLQTVINYMYIVGVESIDIKVNRAQKTEKFVHMTEVFKNVSGKLFNLLDPDFNEPFDFRTPPTEYEDFVTSKLSLKIHPEMEWVSLVMSTDLGNVNYSIVAKVNLRSEHRLAKDGFILNEISTRGKYMSSRDCFKGTSTHVSTIKEGLRGD